jgi:hypothetical protein
VQGIENSSEWLYDGKKAYGPKAARLSVGVWDAKGNYNPTGLSDIMAHGTDEPEKLGTAASHGCVRFPDELIQSYVEKGYLKKGTLFAIVENNNYTPTRINAGPLVADNNSAEQVVQLAQKQSGQKPAGQAFEKYSMNDKKLSFIVDDKYQAKTDYKPNAKVEAKIETKAEAKVEVKAEAKAEVKTEAKTEIK